MNLAQFISVFSFSSLIILSVSAQTRETKSTDVEALRLFEANIGVLSISTSDPCLPEPYSWIKCSSDDIPRITTLDIHGEKIYGITLQDFSAMSALETIDLSGNIFSQEFPDFFANFPKLKVLNLADNFFYGTIPTSLEKNKNLNLTVTGMQAEYLCYSDEDKCEAETGSGTSPGTSIRKSKKKTVPIVLGTVIPIFIIFWVIVGFLAVNHQKKKATVAQNSGALTPGKPMHGNTMSPNPLLPEMNYQDPDLAAENIIPDHHNQQTHPTVQAI
ncbi:hypothetical protein MKX01_036916 [Papaver californicum]|nr:hypothetical protein MKX01_036916 [Papaver californicum]